MLELQALSVDKSEDGDECSWTRVEDTESLAVSEFDGDLGVSLKNHMTADLLFSGWERDRPQFVALNSLPKWGKTHSGPCSRYYSSYFLAGCFPLRGALLRATCFNKFPLFQWNMFMYSVLKPMTLPADSVYNSFETGCRFYVSCHSPGHCTEQLGSCDLLKQHYVTFLP